MSESKHTPEPWCIDTLDRQEHNIVTMYDTHMHNARRAVACVNACAGINPEAVPEFIRVAHLVASLNENCLEIGAGRMAELVTTARAAIAKAEDKS